MKNLSVKQWMMQMDPVVRKRIQEALKGISKRLLAWHDDQILRYDSVRDAEEAYLRAQGKKLPPEFEDFWEFYFDYAADHDFDWSRKIQDADFEAYHEWRLSHSNKWKWLYDNLNGKYIQTDSVIFNKAMTEKHLPEKDKILWQHYKSEALYFQEYFDFKLKEFNTCFRSEDGKPFRENNRPKTKPDKRFLQLLEK